MSDFGRTCLRYSDLFKIFGLKFKIFGLKFKIFWSKIRIIDDIFMLEVGDRWLEVRLWELEFWIIDLYL